MRKNGGKLINIGNEKISFGLACKNILCVVRVLQKNNVYVHKSPSLVSCISTWALKVRIGEGVERASGYNGTFFT